jgi:hypothetical protein
MQAYKIVAVCGLKRSGKDTIAEYLERSMGFLNVKIAGPLKQAVAHTFAFTKDQVEGDMKDDVDPRWGISPRTAMQWFGTDIMQYKAQDIMPGMGRLFWTKHLVTKIHSYPMDQRIVISDLRFKHELDAMRESFSVFVIKVERSACPANDHHVSEEGCTDIAEDAKVTNDGDLGELYEKIRRMTALWTKEEC